MCMPVLTFHPASTAARCRGLLRARQTLGLTQRTATGRSCATQGTAALSSAVWVLYSHLAVNGIACGG